jgi:DNA repair photolyase
MSGMRGVDPPGVGVPVLPVLRVGAVRLRVTATSRSVRFVEQPVRSILNPPESTGMPFWSLNPYIGCAFGCRYCYARFAHAFALERARKSAPFAAAARAGDATVSRPWEAFERTILVKQRERLAEALDRDLARLRRRHVGRQAIGIGTATDPYQPAERQYRLTRLVLERLAAERGFHVAIVTKSPLVTRDISVLRTVAARHELVVHISLISTEVRLVRLFEPRSPVPHARLRALARLVAAGLEASLIIAPVLPGITDGTRHLRALLRAASAAGACSAHVGPLRLYPAVREPLLPILERHFPDLARRYERAYGRATDAPARYRQALDARFAALAAEIGLPVYAFTTTARGRTEQLRLW